MNVDSRPKFKSRKIDDVVLEEIVKDKFIFGSFDNFLLHLTIQLDKLRSVIYYRNDVYNSLWRETAHNQPMMQLFVTYLLKKWNSPLNVTNYESLSIGYNNWVGKTDLYIFSKESEGNIYESKAIIEMKVPFDSNSLYCSKALKSKQQLLGQSVGVLMNNPKNHHSISYLTDIFAISMLFQIKGVAEFIRTCCWFQIFLFMLTVDVL
jgi:hypothetical protein